MATTLFDALLACARALDAVRENEATGGTTTTLVDADLPGLGFDRADEFKFGTLLLINDPNGTIEKLTREVTAYNQANGTLTFSPATATATEAGDHYGVVYPKYPKFVMIGKINESLGELGEIVSTQDIASTGVYEYALTSAYERIESIWHALTTASKQDWEQVFLYQHREGRLLLDRPVDSGRTIRVRYFTTHAYVAADADVINEDINPDWLGVDAALRCARWRLQQSGAEDRALTAQVNDLMVRAARLQARRRMWRPNQVVNIFPFGYPEQ